MTDWRIQFNKEIQERVGLAFYTNTLGDVETEVYMTDENMWMSQQIMSNLFDVQENTITYHIDEVYKSNELDENPTTRKIRVVGSEDILPINTTVSKMKTVVNRGFRKKENHRENENN